MGVSLSGWDSKQFMTDVIKAFTETGKIADDWYIRSNSNETQVVYGNLAAITVKNQADNSELADAGNTETGTTISADSPLKGWVYIPKSVISTHGSAKPVMEYANALGVYLRETYEKQLVNFLATSSPTSVSFNDDAGFTSAEVAAALVEAVTNFDNGKVPGDGRCALLRPTFFTSLWNVAGVRSSDFISGQDNAKTFSELNFLGMKVRSYVGDLNTNQSSNTNYDSKYRTNMTGIHGVAWHRSALACNWYEAPSIEDGEIFDKDSILVKARLLIGTGLTRGAPARQTLTGDA